MRGEREEGEPSEILRNSVDRFFIHCEEKIFLTLSNETVIVVC